MTTPSPRLLSLGLILSLLFSASAAAEKTVVENVTPAQVQKLLKQKTPPQIIDVRTPKEFAQEHIAGAICLNVKDSAFKKKLAQLDKSKPYILHCRSGGRSSQSLKHWKKLGFTKVYHLHKGMIGWKKAKAPTVSGKSH